MSSGELPVISDEYMRERLGATQNYTLVILTVTAEGAKPESRPVIWEHGRRNMALSEAGLLPVVCPVTDDSEVAGIGIFAASPEETRAIMAGDPGVQAGLFTFEIHPVRGFPGAALP